MRPARSDRPTRAVISLVPMIDVLLILLVFFMVTSSYLNLDMIKMVEPAGAGAPSQPTSAATPLMIRLAADGQTQRRLVGDEEGHGLVELHGPLAAGELDLHLHRLARLERLALLAVGGGAAAGPPDPDPQSLAAVLA